MEFNKSTNCTECVHHTNEWLVQIKSKKIVPMHTIDYKSNLSFYSIRREDKLLADGICSNSPIATTHSFLLSILFFCEAQTIVATKFMQLMCFYNGRMCCSAVYVCVHMWTSFDWNITNRNEFFYLLELKKNVRFFSFFRFAQMPFWTINSIFILCQGTAKFKLRFTHTHFRKHFGIEMKTSKQPTIKWFWGND